MAQKTDAALQTQNDTIQNETNTGANTASRVGTMIEDLIDSKMNNDQLLDEDNMASDSATRPASQQSIKAYVDAIGDPLWGEITGTLSNQTDLQTALGLKANLASPALTGTPTAPTASVGTSTTQIATTAFVDAAAAELGDLNIGSITGAISLVSGDLGSLWELSGTTTDYTVDLPTAVGNNEKTIIFKGLAALTKNVTISGISGQTIDGATTHIIGGGGSLTLLSDGANWQIVNQLGSWVNYTPVWGGFSADPTILRAVYFRIGKMCTVHVNTSGGTSNATTLTVTLPFPAKYNNPQAALCVNNGSTVVPWGRIDPVASSSVANGYITSGAGAWTASGAKRISFMITYEIE
jgi:hypothetical protein